MHCPDPHDGQVSKAHPASRCSDSRWQVMKMADELIQQQHCVISLSLRCTCAVLLHVFLKQTDKTSEIALQCQRSLMRNETLIVDMEEETEENLGYFFGGKKF